MAQAPAKKAAPRKHAEEKQAPAATTVTGAANRRRMGELEHEEISIRLAHFLPQGNEFTEGGEAKNAGDTITVKRHQARHLIGAGYAAVDAEDPAAVATALQLGPGTPEDEESLEQLPGDQLPPGDGDGGHQPGDGDPQD